MKKAFSIVALTALLFTTSCQGQFWKSETIKGNGNMTTITRNTGDYDRISCAGSMDFKLVYGTEGTIKIEGEENLLEYIITEVKGDHLVVKVRNGINLRNSRNKDIIITIPYRDIEEVSLTGSGDVWNTDTINEEHLKVSVSGSGDMKLNVKTQRIDSNLTGSGDITLTGNTDFLETKVTGSGDFHGFDLQANTTEAYVTGSGDIDVVCNDFLKARVTGSGDIKYKGNPEKEDTKVTGSGNISN